MGFLALFAVCFLGIATITQGHHESSFTLTQPECESCTPRMVAKHTNRALELLLLDTAPGLDRKISDIVTDTINNPPPPVFPFRKVRSLPRAFQQHFQQDQPPLSEPWMWNTNSYIMTNNNCYNYGNDIRTDTFAQPGRGTGHEFKTVTGAEVMAGAISDHLEYVANKSHIGIPVPARGNLVALVMAPNIPDFHWYRLDPSGYWSHKPGGTRVTNLDNSGNQILDPRYTDRGNYTEFTAFISTRKNVVIIK